MQTKIYEHYTDYFNENSEIFAKKRNFTVMIVSIIITIIAGIVVFWLWFNYESVLNFFMEWTEVSDKKQGKFIFFLQIVKYVSPVVLLFALFIAFFGSFKYVDKRNNSVIKFTILDKFIVWDHEKILELFKDEKFEEILKMPLSSEWQNKLQFWEDSIWKKFYVFLERNGKLFWTKIISEPDYSTLKPLFEENIKNSEKDEDEE